MPKIRAIVLALGVFLSTTAFAQMEQGSPSPPKVLVIEREVVKVGQSQAHEKWERGWPQAFAKANWPVRYLAATSLTGESRALFMIGYPSVEAWEQDNANVRKNAALRAELDALAAKDADYLKESRTGMFVYMPDLSYDNGLNIAAMRYFRITSIQLKPGHDGDFAEIAKLIRAAHEKAGVKENWLIYHLSAGSPGNLYLLFSPMKSLAEEDQSEALHGAAYKAALGDGEKKVAEFNRQAVESTEAQLFKFSPAMSYPRKEWVDADPAYWAPKTAPAGKPTPAKTPVKK